MKVGTISKEVEERKTRVELEGLTPDELIKARTGYGDIQDVRQSINDEIISAAAGGRTLSPPGHAQSQRVMRPLTAESNSLKRDSTTQKKFKMLKELARLNQELRLQKPYAPKDQEKRLTEDRAWSAHTRGQGGFLKRGHGVGGGNVPSAGYGKSKDRRQMRSSSDNARSGSPNQRKGIRALIVDHLKSQL